MTRSWVGWGSAGAFIALAIAVHLGLLDAFDSTVRAWARPHDVWGAAQMRADLVVEGLRPVMVAGLLTAFTAACCVKRRSLRPAVFVGGVCLATMALTVAAKIAIGRPDTHALVGTYGGSFPSGHVIAVTVSVGLAVLVADPRAAGWWVWIIAGLAGGLMGVCLLLQAAHWLTDLVGGSLLAVVVLSVATASGWRRWLHDRPRKDQQSAPPTVRRPSSLTLVGAGRTESKAR
jgi:membrane-associated phospholipid phosphatase